MMPFIRPLLLVLLFAMPAAAENRIDTIRPDAPELAKYGSLPVGVRTMEFTNPGMIDVAAAEANATDGVRPDPLPTVDRKLTVEIFYPAAADASGSTTYEAAMRDGTMVELEGRAMRDAAAASGETYPLVLISHGYPGNRFLLSHLAENIASKGYVVASIDHPASTYTDLKAFGDTLRNRPLDQIAVLNGIAEEAAKEGSPLAGLVDPENAALIGYSMGGYGALIASGAGITEQATKFPFMNTLGLADVHVAGSDTQMKADPRIKTVIAFAPWGKNYEFWSADALASITVPTLLVAGSQDDVSGYENGVRAVFEQMKGADRALLTYEGANHNAGAPMPAPAEALAKALEAGTAAPYDHYADAVWDNVRMNNVAQHFVTAWLNRALKGDAEANKYLELVPVAADGVVSVEEDGTRKDDYSYWEGFPARTAKGLRYETRAAGE